MSRLDCARLLRDKCRIDCVNCSAAIAAGDEACRYCRSVPSLLDVARLARALDPGELLAAQAVHETPARASALQCAACGAALPVGVRMDVALEPQDQPGSRGAARARDLVRLEVLGMSGAVAAAAGLAP